MVKSHFSDKDSLQCTRVSSKSKIRVFSFKEFQDGKTTNSLLFEVGAEWSSIIYSMPAIEQALIWVAQIAVKNAIYISAGFLKEDYLLSKDSAEVKSNSSKDLEIIRKQPLSLRSISHFTFPSWQFEQDSPAFAEGRPMYLVLPGYFLHQLSTPHLWINRSRTYRADEEYENPMTLGLRIFRIEIEADCELAYFSKNRGSIKKPNFHCLFEELWESQNCLHLATRMTQRSLLIICLI
jgi:hypothetical protein